MRFPPRAGTYNLAANDRSIVGMGRAIADWSFLHDNQRLQFVFRREPPKAGVTAYDNKRLNRLLRLKNRGTNTAARVVLGQSAVYLQLAASIVERTRQIGYDPRDAYLRTVFQ